MYVICVNDGITVGGRVYKTGELFNLTAILMSTFGSLSDDQSARRQTKMYGEVYFRRPTSEELLSAYKDKKLTMDSLESSQRKMLAIAAQSKQERLGKLVDVLSEQEDIDVQPIEKFTESEPEPKEEPPKEELPKKPVVKKKTGGRKKPSAKKK